jgi:hypothetical protein
MWREEITGSVEIIIHFASGSANKLHALGIHKCLEHSKCGARRVSVCAHSPLLCLLLLSLYIYYTLSVAPVVWRRDIGGAQSRSIKDGSPEEKEGEDRLRSDGP